MANEIKTPDSVANEIKTPDSISFKLKTPDTIAYELKKALDLYDGGLDKPLSAAERRCLPIALALQPMWGVGGWVALLDDEGAARKHASGMMWDVDFGNHIMDNLREWQNVFN